MIETIIALLVSNKAIIGAVVSIGEGIVVIINLWTKFRGKNGGVEPMSAPPSVFKDILWVINPANCFRKPK